MSMHSGFRSVVESLHPSFERLLKATPASTLNLPNATPLAGVYLLSEGGRHLYVGRSNRIRKRLSNHCRVGATHKMAAFAFRLARESTGRTIASYQPDGSREDLMRDSAFARAFDEAKARIRVMDVRVVAEPDPVRQAVLEIYVAVSLATPYNDFDTH